MTHMTEDSPTVEELQKQIEVLEGELDELQSQVDQVKSLKKTVEYMAERLAKKHGEPMIDWWWVE